MVRTASGPESGSRVEFVQNDQGQFSIVPVTSSVLELKGMLKKPKKLVSIDDMNRVIAEQGAKAR